MMVGSSPRRRSGISPTTPSSTSSTVTTPSTSPYSSITSAMLTRAWRSASSARSTGMLVVHDQGRAHGGAQIQRPAGEAGIQQTAHMDDAEHVV